MSEESSQMSEESSQMSENDVFLLLGSNLGDKANLLKQAQQLLQERLGFLEKQSSIYETEPWGNTEQPTFWNQVLQLKTSLQAEEILKVTQNIELEMGRTPSEKWGSRLIDIDILYLEEEIVNLINLQIPHPQIPYRRFTLKPLVEISPNFIHPVLMKTQQELLELCDDISWVNKIS